LKFHTTTKVDTREYIAEQIRSQQVTVETCNVTRRKDKQATCLLEKKSNILVARIAAEIDRSDLSQELGYKKTSVQIKATNF